MIKHGMLDSYSMFFIIRACEKKKELAPLSLLDKALGMSENGIVTQNSIVIMFPMKIALCGEVFRHFPTSCDIFRHGSPPKTHCEARNECLLPQLLVGLFRHGSWRCSAWGLLFIRWVLCCRGRWTSGQFQSFP